MTGVDGAATAAGRKRPMYFRVRPELVGLRFDHPTKGRRCYRLEDLAPRGPVPVPRTLRDGEGRPIAVVSLGTKPTGVSRLFYAVTYDDWYPRAWIVLPRRTRPITPPAVVAEGPAPAVSGESRDGGTMTAYDYEPEHPDCGPAPLRDVAKASVGAMMFWVFVAIMVIAAIVVAFCGSAKADGPRQWTHPVYYQACPGGRCPQPAPVAAQYRPTPGPSAPAPAPAATPADPLAYVNAYRTLHGVAPLAYDATAARWAEANNAQQSRRGLGHHVTGGMGQCAGVGYRDAAHVAWGWYTSPGHRALMLSPRFTRGAVARLGACWTLNVR